MTAMFDMNEIPRLRFGVALNMLLTGQCKAIRRHWWHEKVKIKLEDVGYGDEEKDLVVTTTTMKIVYRPNRDDIFANDWEYLREWKIKDE